jgi:hypothetical protein
VETTLQLIGDTGATQGGGVAGGDREAVVARARDLFIDGELPYQGFSCVLDLAFAARDRADLVATMSALPPPVRLTPAPLRLDGPLFVRAVDRGTRFRPGWQLAPDTTVATGTGRIRLDLAGASWDSRNIHLRLETWGSVEVLVPAGVAVQIVFARAPVLVEPLASPAPGAPILRISAIGPTGVITVRNSPRRQDASARRPRRRRAVRGRTPNSWPPVGTPGTVRARESPRRSHSA